jgi:hypothetical protein
MMQGGYEQVELTEIGDFFVRDILKVSQSGPGATSDIVILIAMANTYTIRMTPEEEIASVLARIPVDDANTLRSSYDRLIERQLTQMQAQYHEQLALGVQEPTAPNMATPVTDRRTVAATIITPVNTTGAVATTVNTPPSAAVTHTPPDAPVRHQQVDLAERKQLKTMRTTLEKIEALVRIDEERTTGSLTSGAKTFASKFLKPAINCLKNHCGGDCAAFAEKYKDFSHTTFPEKYCAGEGAVCAPKEA